ncbi:Nup53/35/40-type RNA recognition motif containing protein [Novymonas esmeraldas]|uniref:Nup53/35/40-type RNA recognition motif containing protein n=1 Tax=Novymonas esmeraldas TaxID=1808958 RepID=A0AAW0EMX5_9TRYP
MWKQSAGDWQERRHRRRGGPAPDSPHAAHLPDSVVSAESTLRAFLPREFHDRGQQSAYPAVDGPESRPPSSSFTPLEQQTLARAIASTWVVVSGVSPDDVLDVRAYLDVHVGHTVAHHVPLAAPTQSEAYIQFASAAQAAQAVHMSACSFHVESGTAAAGLRLSVAGGDVAAAPPRSLELVIGWCRDQVFLEARERLRRRLLEAGPRLPRNVETSQASARQPSSSSPASPSLESSARGSDDDGDAVAHPLLPRHRGRSSSAASASPPRAHSRLSAAVAHPPLVDAQDYCYQNDGVYREEDRFFSGGLHSSFSSGRRRTTLLSLFVHPCSFPASAPWTLIVLPIVRLVVVLVWTAWNMAAQFLPSTSVRRTAQHFSDRQRRNVGGGGDAAAAAAAAPVVLPPPPVLPQPSRWKLRRSLRAADVVPASASPLQYLSFFFYKYVPFSPEPEEVDVALWSWFVLRSPYPQQSLRLLKQSLLTRQRAGGATDMTQWTSFGRMAVLGGEPLTEWEAQQQQQQRAGRRREPPVLLTWRPAWWFARYSTLSFFLVMALAGFYCFQVLLEHV